MTGKDAIQLQLIYKEYCPALPTANCSDGAPYLMVNHCDGHGDCAYGDDDEDDTDERNCTGWCPNNLKVTSTVSNDTNQFLGNYIFKDMMNNAQYWIQQSTDSVERYLYRKAGPDNYWHFGLNLNESCYIYGYDWLFKTGCPSDGENEWFKVENGSFVSYSALSVTEGHLTTTTTVATTTTRGKMTV